MENFDSKEVQSLESRISACEEHLNKLNQEINEIANLFHSELVHGDELDPLVKKFDELNEEWAKVRIILAELKNPVPKREDTDSN
jgi:uncharacterized coiled-coil DUF342 family protein